MFVLKRDNLIDLLDYWSKNFDVYTPKHNEGQVMLLPYENDNLTLEYTNFASPVKEFLFKQKEVLFGWRKDNDKITIDDKPQSHVCQNKHRVLFGIRPCDAYGIKYTDKFFLEGYKDNIYYENRESTSIVVMNCIEPGEDCFCSSMKTGPFADGGYDLLFTPLENIFLVEPGSKKGAELLLHSKDLFTEAPEALLKEKNEEYNSSLKKFKTEIKCTNINKILENNFENPLWKSIADDCIGCTGCTNLCPTCTCFNVIEKTRDSSSGNRIRYWDSCQTSSFTRNAGEHNPRNNISKVRYRIYDKFKYIEEKFSFKGCTGCGRCINVCPAGINVVNIINSLSIGFNGVSKEISAMEKNHTHAEICEKVYIPQIAVIKNIIEETKNIKRFVLQFEDKSLHESFQFKGQFFEITVFGVGEIAISIPFSPKEKENFEFCVKRVGKVTDELHKMKVGDKVGLRGPFGKGFPYESFLGKDVLIVGSGVGLAPVRTMILNIVENRQDFGKVVIIASALSYEDLIYKQDLIQWSKIRDVKVLYALNNPTDKVSAHVGYINDLLPVLNLNWSNTASILCASPKRIKAVAKDLLDLGMKKTDIYTSLETHMRCGIGKCGHCKVGNKYMCIDGPVFNYEEMLALPPEF